MAIKINGTNTTASPGITGPDTDTGLVYGTDEVQVVTGGTERLKVDSSGNVGMGTSSFTATSSGRQILEINGTSSSLINLDVGGTRKAYHFTDGTDVYSYNTANGNYIFGTNNTERIRILSSGGITFNGDTAAANALNDYERGTWTPVGNANFNGITSAEGQYEKIGNLVNVVFQFNYSSLDSSTTSAAIAGLPFAVADFNSLTGVEATGVCFGTNKHVLVYASSTNLHFETSKPLYGSTSAGADFFRGNISYLAG